MPRRGGGRGDLFVEIHLSVPTSLTPAQEGLVAELGRALREGQLR
jgi:hypothetical protein